MGLKTPLSPEGVRRVTWGGGGGLGDELFGGGGTLLDVN